MGDTYQTLASPSTGLYKEKGSKFIGYAFEVSSEKEIKAYLEEVKKEHFKARHHCYAYRLGLDGKLFRANDDGEPSSTAGRPILGQIDSFGLSNVLIVVVRYFGGTKLGTSGLKRSYKAAAQDALTNAEIIERIVKQQFSIHFDYLVTNDIMKYLKATDITILDARYENLSILDVSVRQDLIPDFMASMKDIEGTKVEEL